MNNKNSGRDGYSIIIHALNPHVQHTLRHVRTLYHFLALDPRIVTTATNMPLEQVLDTQCIPLIEHRWGELVTVIRSFELAENAIDMMVSSWNPNRQLYEVSFEVACWIFDASRRGTEKISCVDLLKLDPALQLLKHFGDEVDYEPIKTTLAWNFVLKHEPSLLQYLTEDLDIPIYKQQCISAMDSRKLFHYEPVQYVKRDTVSKNLEYGQVVYYGCYCPDTLRYLALNLHFFTTAKSIWETYASYHQWKVLQTWISLSETSRRTARYVSASGTSYSDVLSRSTFDFAYHIRSMTIFVGRKYDYTFASNTEREEYLQFRVYVANHPDCSNVHIYDNDETFKAWFTASPALRDLLMPSHAIYDHRTISQADLISKVTGLAYHLKPIGCAIEMQDYTLFLKYWEEDLSTNSMLDIIYYILSLKRGRVMHDFLRIVVDGYVETTGKIMFPANKRLYPDGVALYQTFLGATMTADQFMDLYMQSSEWDAWDIRLLNYAKDTHNILPAYSEVIRSGNIEALKWYIHLMKQVKARRLTELCKPYMSAAEYEADDQMMIFYPVISSRNFEITRLTWECFDQSRIKTEVSAVLVDSMRQIHTKPYQNMVIGYVLPPNTTRKNIRVQQFSFKTLYTWIEDHKWIEGSILVLWQSVNYMFDVFPQLIHEMKDEAFYVDYLLRSSHDAFKVLMRHIGKHEELSRKLLARDEIYQSIEIEEYDDDEDVKSKQIVAQKWPVHALQNVEYLGQILDLWHSVDSDGDTHMKQKWLKRWIRQSFGFYCCVKGNVRYARYLRNRFPYLNGFFVQILEHVTDNVLIAALEEGWIYRDNLIAAELKKWKKPYQVYASYSNREPCKFTISGGQW